MTFDKLRSVSLSTFVGAIALWTALISQSSANTNSFDIRIEAQANIRDLLERHLQLQRYRAVSDLEDAELARLIELADSDVRNLLGTLGYFSPNVQRC